MTDRERFGPSWDELRSALAQVATTSGATVALDHLKRIAGVRRLGDAGHLNAEQRFRLLEELQSVRELLS